MHEQITYKYTDVPPPAPLYITPDDVIRVTAYNSVAGQILLISARILTPQNKITYMSDELRPRTDRTESAKMIKLPEGFLISFCIVPDGVATRRGQTFVVAGLQKSEVYANRLYHTFFADYVETRIGLHWPPGQIRSPEEGPGFVTWTTGTKPAAGEEAEIAVPDNAVWEPIVVKTALITDATVADRRLDLKISDGTTVLLHILSQATQPASTEYFYSWAQGASEHNVVGNSLMRRLPFNLKLRAGWTIKTLTIGLKAGDQIEALQVYYKEWIQE